MSKQKPEGVTYTQNFAAEIRKKLDDPKNNRLAIKSITWFQYQLNKFRDGEQVTLVIHSRRSKRSEQQNRYYWGAYLPIIAEETGEKDLDKLHELFKGKFLTEGVVEVLGEKVRMKKSTTALSISDFCQYITDIENLTNVKAPPTENYDLASLEEYDDLSTD